MNISSIVLNILTVCACAVAHEYSFNKANTHRQCITNATAAATAKGRLDHHQQLHWVGKKTSTIQKDETCHFCPFFKLPFFGRVSIYLNG